MGLRGPIIVQYRRLWGTMRELCENSCDRTLPEKKDSIYRRLMAVLMGKFVVIMAFAFHLPLQFLGKIWKTVRLSMMGFFRTDAMTADGQDGNETIHIWLVVWNIFFFPIIYGMCVILGYLVGGVEHEFNFSIIYGIILPIDFHIFQDGFFNHQPDMRKW